MMPTPQRCSSCGEWFSGSDCIDMFPICFHCMSLGITSDIMIMSLKSCLDDEWHDFSNVHPAVAGRYVWKVPYRENYRMVFVAHFYAKLLGSTDLLPAFSHWNGRYSVVPENTQWRIPTEEECGVKEKYEYDLLGIEHLDKPIKLKPCPFCKNVPSWKGLDGFIGSFPHQDRKWALACCSWIRSNNYSDPLELANVWNNAQ